MSSDWQYVVSDCALAGIGPLRVERYAMPDSCGAKIVDAEGRVIFDHGSLNSAEDEPVLEAIVRLRNERDGLARALRVAIDRANERDTEDARTRRLGAALVRSVRHLRSELGRVATDFGAGFSCDVVDDAESAVEVWETWR